MEKPLFEDPEAMQREIRRLRFELHQARGYGSAMSSKVRAYETMLVITGPTSPLYTKDGASVIAPFETTVAEMCRWGEALKAILDLEVAHDPLDTVADVFRIARAAFAVGNP